MIRLYGLGSDKIENNLQQLCSVRCYSANIKTVIFQKCNDTKLEEAPVRSQTI